MRVTTSMLRQDLSFLLSTPLRSCLPNTPLLFPFFSFTMNYWYINLEKLAVYGVHVKNLSEEDRHQAKSATFRVLPSNLPFHPLAVFILC